VVSIERWDGYEVEYSIGEMLPTDWERVRTIYVEGIATGHATFEAEAPDWERWDSSHLPEPRLVVRVNGEVVAWAAISRTSDRCAYIGVAEVSVYVAEDFRGRGVGSALLASIIEASERVGFWTLQAGIFPENVVSLNLHKKHGFRVVGYRERIGKMTFGDYKGKWRNVVIMEWRSNVTGID